MPDIPVLDVPTYDEELAGVRAEYVSRAKARGVEITAFVETDPAEILMESFAYRMWLRNMDWRERLARSYVSEAEGDDLLALAADRGIYPSQGLLDEQIRNLIRQRPASYSTAGPAPAYRFFAMSVEGVADVGITKPQDGTVQAAVAGFAEDGTSLAAPSDALVAAVAAALDRKRVRPWTDTVNVVKAAAKAVDVTAALTLADGAGSSVRAGAEAALRAFVAGRTERVGQMLPVSAIYAHLSQPGVERVQLTKPAADVAATAVQWVELGTVTIT